LTHAFHTDYRLPSVPTKHGSANPPPSRSAQDRLLDGVTRLAAHDGYARLTVERILAASGVSRATFYQYFSNVDDCFRTAYRHHADQLVSDVIAAAEGSEQWERTVFDVLLATVTSRSDIAGLLMREGLAAGPAGVLERDVLIARIEQAMTGFGARKCTIDLPPAILIGGMFRFLSMRLTDRGGRDELGGEIRQWVGAFARRPTQYGWSARFAAGLPSRVTTAPPQPTSPPRGSVRERILRATAATIREKGYRDITVADIVTAAGVSRRAFYNLFQSKPDAFTAVYEHAFQQALAACTPAFFTPRAWPERVWHGAHAFTGFFSSEPLFAHIGFVECYATGPGFATRVHDTQLAFTLFLEDGYRQRPEARSLSRACSALSATAIFELAFQVSRRSPSMYLRAVQPLAVYIALAPFIGADEAGEFLMAKLSAPGTAASASA
jgi:AcrR family transcriptional regulator